MIENHRILYSKSAVPVSTTGATSTSIPWHPVRDEVVIYGAPPPIPSGSYPLNPGFPPGIMTTGAFSSACAQCSDSRILFAPTGPEPCPACCQKLVVALRMNEERDRERELTRNAARGYEVLRLKAKVNRLLRKLKARKT